MSYTDEELLQKFKDPGSRNWAFDQIVVTYRERLYWHIRRMVINHDDADDLTQNAFIKAWNALDNFKGESGLFTWLYRIGTNESLTFLKKQRTRFFMPIVDVEHKLAESLESDEYFSGDEIQRKLQKAILTLPEKQRLIFNLKYFDELKYDQISDITGTSVGALKASYHHAVKKIEHFLKDD